MSDNNPYQQPSYDQPVFGQAASVQPGPASPPPKKKGWSVAVWVLLILGIIFVLGCGCCAGTFYWAFGFLSTAVKESYEDNPIVVEKIGEIQSASFNMQETGEVGGGNLVFDIKGSKANGKLIVREQNKQNGSFGGAKLVVDGEEFELGPSKPMGGNGNNKKTDEDKDDKPGEGKPEKDK